MTEEIEPHLKVKLAFVFTALLIILMPAASAASVGAYNVKETEEYVKATALCSCGLNGYHYMTGCFINYCPICNSHGTLSFNPKGTPEGEWTCKKCGCDYCAADGKEKMPSHVYLKQYKVPKSAQTNVSEVHAQQVTLENSKVNLLNKIVYYSNKSFLRS